MIQNHQIKTAGKQTNQQQKNKKETPGFERSIWKEYHAKWKTVLW